MGTHALAIGTCGRHPATVVNAASDICSPGLSLSGLPESGSLAR